MPSHFEMEQALRSAGVAVRPYPKVDEALLAADQALADRMLIAAGTAWEREVERLYAIQMQAHSLSLDSGFGKRFDEICTVDGVDAALVDLNRGVDHRYTGAYRLRGEKMVNISLADKLGQPRPEFLAEVPFASSFCQYVLRDGSFLTGDSGKDHRLDGHPYQGTMLAYCGVPVFDFEGKAIGTLCHFDVEVREVADEHIDRMHAAARILANYLA